jgi:hypothetical protein
VLRSENGPHGATKKEYEKAKVLMNQFLNADTNIAAAPAPAAAAGEATAPPVGAEQEAVYTRSGAVPAHAYADPSPMANAYPIGNLEHDDKNK